MPSIFFSSSRIHPVQNRLRILIVDFSNSIFQKSSADLRWVTVPILTNCSKIKILKGIEERASRWTPQGTLNNCAFYFFFSSSRTHPRQSWYTRGSRQRYQPHLHYFVNTSAASLCILVSQWKCKCFHQTKLSCYFGLLGVESRDFSNAENCLQNWANSQNDN